MDAVEGCHPAGSQPGSLLQGAQPQPLCVTSFSLFCEVSQWEGQWAGVGSSFLRNVILGDATWVHVYDPGTKVQSSQWKSVCQSRPDLKVMLIELFGLGGIVGAEFVPRNAMIPFY